MSAPSADPIRDLIVHLADTGAKIEHVVDPSQPNRVGYRITHKTREAVQVVVDNLCAYVDGGCGYANFVGPGYDGEQFCALGEVVIQTPVFS